jgi:hypothetical protein
MTYRQARLDEYISLSLLWEYPIVAPRNLKVHILEINYTIIKMPVEIKKRKRRGFDCGTHDYFHAPYITASK